MVELKNPGAIEFEATIQTNQDAKSSNAWVEFPYDLKQTYGKGNLVPVKVTFDKRVQYIGSLAKMGGDHALIILRKDIREQLGKEPGDTVHIRVELDTAQRQWPVSQDAKTALLKADQWATFQKLAYSHQREYFRWIDEARRPETRVARIRKMCEMLATGKKEPR